MELQLEFSVWIETQSTATAGQGFTISSGGAIAGTADLAGGDLTLKSGTSTGTGSSAIHFYTATAGLTGTADNAPTEKVTILNNGNVGIGTTGPNAMLDISTATANAANIHLTERNVTGGEEGGIIWRGYYNTMTTLFDAVGIKRINISDNNAADNQQRLGFLFEILL